MSRNHDVIWIDEETGEPWVPTTRMERLDWWAGEHPAVWAGITVVVFVIAFLVTSYTP